MAICPSCKTENDAGAAACKQCGALLAATYSGAEAAEETEWVQVYSGHGPALRGLEEELKRRGITAVRMPTEVGAAFEVGIFGTDEGSNYILAVPPDQYETRRADIDSAVQEFTGAAAGDPAAEAEAEQDYDVRACPTCRRFFHDTYAACPGDGTPLVPAVECFTEGQLEPEWVVVRHGPETAMREVAALLETSLFKVRVESPGGWPALVEISWAGLIDRTAEAEAIVRG